MKNLIKTYLLVIAVTLSSCSKEEAPSQETKLAVDFETVNTPFSTQASGFSNKTKQSSTAGTVYFAEGYIAISTLEFKAESERNAVEVEFELEQNTLIDFATGTTTPDINSILIPAGTYDEVSIEMELREDSEEPSILLFGTYLAPDGVEHAVRLEFFSDESFEVEREGLIVFEQDQAAVAQIIFDPSVWFAAVTDDHFANATKDENGVIVVSSTENNEIYNLVSEGFELAREVEVEDEDEDDNEEEDEDEDDEDDDE